MSDSCDPMSCVFPTFSSVHGISHAGILEWVAVSFFRGSSQPRDQTWVYCIGRRFLYHFLLGSPVLIYPALNKAAKIVCVPQVPTARIEMRNNDAKFYLLCTCITLVIRKEAYKFTEKNFTMHFFSAIPYFPTAIVERTLIWNGGKSSNTTTSVGLINLSPYFYK